MTRQRRVVSYTWTLRKVMAEAGLFATTDLIEPLAERGVTLSASQVHRLVTTPPERLNLTVLAAKGTVLGFDCGPGNALMDGWCQRHTGKSYDDGGSWAASGTVMPALLDRLLAEPFIHADPPKSTGRDLFNLPWLEARLGALEDTHPADVQATLLAYTAQTCALAVRTSAAGCEKLIVCGGGAYNTGLMQELGSRLPDVAVVTSAEAGIAPDQVEAAAFAWLAHKAVRRETTSLKSITGTRGARVLGAIYPR